MAHLDRIWWVLGAVAGYLLLMFTSPVRRNMLHGLRCLQRYAEIWGILAVLGLSYAIWQLGVRLLYYFVLPEGYRPVFQWSRAFFLPRADQLDILRESILPALEGVAGIFNNLVTTYPVSALAAILLLINWEGHHGVLNRALRQRFGFAGWILHAFIVVCALAALVKPALYAALPILGGTDHVLLVLRGSLVIDWLSFVFEYFFGVCIQIYLILLAYVWVRGLSFTHPHLLDFAIRRFSAVMRWTTLVVILSSLLIHLPSFLQTYQDWSSVTGGADFVDTVARPFLVGFLLLFCAVQITLTFHSESLGDAVRDNFHFLRRHWWPVMWFLLIAFVHFYLLTVFNRFVLSGAGEGTMIGVLWQLCNPVLLAAIGGWLLSSWVSLFKTCETSESHLEKMVRY